MYVGSFRWGPGLKLTLPARAMHLLASSPSLVLVVIMQNLHLFTKATRSSTFSFNDGSWMLVAVYGSAGLSPVSVLLKDMLLLVLAKNLL